MRLALGGDGSALIFISRFIGDHFYTDRSERPEPPSPTAVSSRPRPMRRVRLRGLGHAFNRDLSSSIRNGSQQAGGRGKGGWDKVPAEGGHRPRPRPTFNSPGCLASGCQGFSAALSPPSRQVALVLLLRARAVDRSTTGGPQRPPSNPHPPRSPPSPHTLPLCPTSATLVAQRAASFRVVSCNNSPPR